LKDGCKKNGKMIINYIIDKLTNGLKLANLKNNIKNLIKNVWNQLKIKG